MSNPRFVKPLSIDGIPSDRGQCDWADRPMVDNLIGDRLQITNRGSRIFTWDGTTWNDSNNLSAAVTASRDATIFDSGVVLLCTSASPIAITVQSDTASSWSGLETLVVYQAGAGATTFAAGSGVTLRGTAPTAAQYLTTSIYRVAANEWAYL